MERCLPTCCERNRHENNSTARRYQRGQFVIFAAGTADDSRGQGNGHVPPWIKPRNGRADGRPEFGANAQDGGIQHADLPIPPGRKTDAGHDHGPQQGPADATGTFSHSDGRATARSNGRLMH